MMSLFSFLIVIEESYRAFGRVFFIAGKVQGDTMKRKARQVVFCSAGITLDPGRERYPSSTTIIIASISAAGERNRQHIRQKSC
jgi:hypothetical protein